MPEERCGRLVTRVDAVKGRVHQLPPYHDSNSYSNSRSSQHSGIASPCLSTSSLTDDVYLWSSVVVPVLRKALRCAEYSTRLQEEYLFFFDHFLAPSLGRFPGQSDQSEEWRSFMTDDFTPVELSLSLNGKSQQIRFSTEPISYRAGSAVDPFNIEMSDIVAQELSQNIAEMDRTWYDILRKELVVDHFSLDKLNNVSLKRENLSQIFFGFDFGEDGISTKAYFLPTLKAISSSQTRLQVVSDTLHRLENNELKLRPSFSMLEDFILTSAAPKPELEIASIDCVDPVRSRFKCYVRNRRTSFASVCNVFTLGGRLTYATMADDLEKLRELWYSVLDLPHDYPVDEELKPSSSTSDNHRTSGILYYFALRPGSAVPQPKVYIPVRHYAKNDRQVAHGLEKGFRRRGWTNIADNYVKNLESIFPHRPLESGRGLHTYVCFSIKKGSVTIEPYLNPEIYSQAIKP